MSKITIKLNIEEDAWNWWDACNKVSHGVDWKLKIPKKLRDKIYRKDKDEAFAFLLPYLKSYYENKPIAEYIKKIQHGFDERQEKIFSTMEIVTNRPIYRENFTCFITSFPRFPYRLEKGQIWLSSKRDVDYQVLIFIHELLHFQYFKYFGERVWDELGAEKHARLKEAMTVILNDEFKEVTQEKDEGYEIDFELREVLLSFWRKSSNMDVFISKSIEYLKAI